MRLLESLPIHMVAAITDHHFAQTPDHQRESLAANSDLFLSAAIGLENVPAITVFRPHRLRRWTNATEPSGFYRVVRNLRPGTR